MKTKKFVIELPEEEFEAILENNASQRGWRKVNPSPRGEQPVENKVSPEDYLKDVLAKEMLRVHTNMEVNKASAEASLKASEAKKKELEKKYKL